MTRSSILGERNAHNCPIYMLLLCCCCSCCLFIHLGRSSCRRISWHGEEEDRTIKINKWKENTQTRRRCNAAGGSACKNIVFYGDVQGRAGAPAAPESVQNEPTNEWMDGWTNKSLLISCAKPFATRFLLLLVLLLLLLGWLLCC